MAKRYNKICAYCGVSISYRRGEKPDSCPGCGKERWLKPETETKLFLLQKKYLKTRDSYILGSMYLILKSYASSIIKKVVSGKFRYDFDWLAMKAHDATNRLLIYYLAKPNFKVEQSFGSYLQWKVKEVLYTNKNEENHDSLNQLLRDSNQKEFQDLVYLNGYKPVFGKTISDYEERMEQEKYFIEDLMNLIERQLIKIKLKSIHLSLITCVCLKILLDKRNNALIVYYNKFGGCSKGLVDKIVNIINILIRRYTKGETKVA